MYPLAIGFYQSALEAKEKEYRRVLTEFTDKTKDLKLSSNIGSTTQTYDQFFKENENIKKYIIQKDALISERNNNNLLFCFSLKIYCCCKFKLNKSSFFLFKYL